MSEDELMRSLRRELDRLAKPTSKRPETQRIGRIRRTMGGKPFTLDRHGRVWSIHHETGLRNPWIATRPYEPLRGVPTVICKDRTTLRRTMLTIAWDLRHYYNRKLPDA